MKALGKRKYQKAKEIVKDIYSTWCSKAVTHLSTNHARRCLTPAIGLEPVFSTWYGRRQWTVSIYYHKATQYHPVEFRPVSDNKCIIF